ncbi:MAG: 1-acyl-sn-glycerol-3-phosphate acyltransferase [Bacteroidales bacterium]|nr:1-acyl-sn-glycerol-3-phosphate acyltransferase [Bacteroidales bacterium]
METFDFNNIRSFRDEEVNKTLRELISDEGFLYILRKIFTEERIARLGTELNDVKSVYNFQSKYISFYVNVLIRLSVKNFTHAGLENLDKSKSYLFISNHRDIVLDSALINELLYRSGFQTSEIAIGNNLLIYKWIENLVRLNKSFIVRRGLAGKEMLQASMKLSAYIRDTVVNRNTSVWIAQKEGRSKDGHDYTDTALLKMLNFSGSNDFVKDFTELNIVPVSISYENEPTIESKIAATYSKLKGEEYKKSLEDDMKDMGRGLYNMKGDVNITFGKPLNEDIKTFNTIKNKNERFSKLTSLIDNQIYTDFKLNKANYIAFDILNNSNKCLKEGKYFKEDETKLKVQCKKIVSSMNGDPDLTEKIFYGIYAKPLINKINLP